MIKLPSSLCASIFAAYANHFTTNSNPRECRQASEKEAAMCIRASIFKEKEGVVQSSTVGEHNETKKLSQNELNGTYPPLSIFFSEHE